MGDRANFGFTQSNGNTIVVYGHWAGHDMLSNLAAAVESAQSRWTDESYATRICISYLVGEDYKSTTGWGLHVNELGDNEHKVPVINWSEGTFSLYDTGMDENAIIRGIRKDPLFTMPLQAFVDKYGLVLV
jgi:hypothetical protein